MSVGGEGVGEKVGALGVEERVWLLGYARRAVGAAVGGAGLPVLEVPLSLEVLKEPRACFVTLRLGEELRGCIGQLVAREPLWEAVGLNAMRAATQDHRFESVRAEEVGQLRVEVSVLTRPVWLEGVTGEGVLERLRPGMDGVVLEVEGRTSTFLPQVWEELVDKVRFMGRLSEKAGLDREGWRREGARVSVYQVEHFEDGPWVGTSSKERA